MPPSSDARTWVIVLNYFGRDCVGACLQSLRALEAPQGGFRTLVVDNGSTDGSVAFIRAEFPECEIIENHVNLGFSGGNNLGIKRALAAGADYIALLNMDAVADPNWLKTLVDNADARPEAGLLGSLILTADGALAEFDGRQFDPVTTAGGYLDEPASLVPRHTVEARYACGAGVLMRAEMLRDAGLLEDCFLVYHEDVELSVRARRAGYAVLNVGGSVIYHRRGASNVGEKFKIFSGARNMLLTLFKHYDRVSFDRNGADLRRLFLTGGSTLHRAAFLSGLQELPRILAKRRVFDRNARRKKYSNIVKRG